jgi:asparagine synthase (glutamine-hydrolysing)
MAAIRDHFGRRELIAGARELTGALRHDGEVFGPWLRDFVSQTVRRRVGSRAAARPGWMARNLPPAEGAPAPDGAAAGLSALARMSRADLTSGNIPAVLALTDRNAMAHSVESRVPFLDHRIVEFGLALPDRFKASRGARKVVLRDLARRRLPAVIAGRGGRIGFGMPLAEWLRGPLRPGVLETVTGPGVMSHTVFDAGATLRFVTDFLDGRHEDAASVWRIVAVARWLQKFRIEM